MNGLSIDRYACQSIVLESSIQNSIITVHLGHATMMIRRTVTSRFVVCESQSTSNYVRTNNESYDFRKLEIYNSQSNSMKCKTEYIKLSVSKLVSVCFEMVDWLWFGSTYQKRNLPHEANLSTSICRAMVIYFSTKCEPDNSAQIVRRHVNRRYLHTSW
jgi:hypothetical protein